MYDKQDWQNAPSTATPINAERLNHIEDGIEAAANQAAEAGTDIAAAVDRLSDGETALAIVETRVTDIEGDVGTTAATLASIFVYFAANPENIIVGAITRDDDGAATTAPVVWPDGSPGTYTATVLSIEFPGATDAYVVTYGSPVTRTYTQPTVTRDSTGAVVNRPAMVVS